MLTCFRWLTSFLQIIMREVHCKSSCDMIELIREGNHELELDWTICLQLNYLLEALPRFINSRKLHNQPAALIWLS